MADIAYLNHGRQMAIYEQAQSSERAKPPLSRSPAFSASDGSFSAPNGYEHDKYEHGQNAQNNQPHAREITEFSSQQQDNKRIALSYEAQGENQAENQDIDTANAPITHQQTPLFGHDGFSVSDIIDIVNPLQNIPIVNSFYRHLTGDEIDAGSRLVGGTLYGGPIGLALAFVDERIKENTGGYVGDHILAQFQSNETTKEAEPALNVAKIIDEADAQLLARAQTGSLGLAPQQSRLAFDNRQFSHTQTELALDVSRQIQQAQMKKQQDETMPSPQNNEAVNDQNNNIGNPAYERAVNLFNQLPPPKAVAPAPLPANDVNRLSGRRHGDEPLSEDSITFLNEFANLVRSQGQHQSSQYDMAGNPFAGQNRHQMPATASIPNYVQNNLNASRQGQGLSPQSKLIQAINKYNEIQGLNG